MLDTIHYEPSVMYSDSILETADDPFDRKWTWEEDGYTVYRSHARTGPGCHDNCGVLLYVKDGILEKIEGDEENPYNQGRLCLRCLSFKEMLYHPDRLRHPMKRIGERGENKWEQMTWDASYDYIEENFRKIFTEYGNESLYVCKGTGRDTNGYYARVAESLNSPNSSAAFFCGNSCYLPRVASTGLKLGDLFISDYSQFSPLRFDDPRYIVPKCVIVWGNNFVAANSDGTLGYWLLECMKRGTELITIDPTVTWVAVKSKIHLQIRSGTDSALALAMANVICEEGLYDCDFVEKWTYGFEDYSEHLKTYTPEFAADVCGIDAEDIREAARMFASAKPASIQWGVALDHTKDGFFAGMAVMDLLPLTGNIENPGGAVIGRPYWGITQGWTGSRPAYGPKVLDDAQLDKRLNDNHAMMQAMGATSPDDVVLALETGDPYPIKAVWMLQTNPLACMGSDPHRLHKALMNADFIVVTDLFMTPTALAVADVVLPACTFAERIGVSGHQPFNLGSIVQAVAPVGESRSDQEIINDISKRFSPEGNPWEHDLGIYNCILQKANIDYDYLKQRVYAYPNFEYYRHEKGLLRPDGQPGFQTASGRYEFKCDSFELFDLPIMPIFTEPPESPRSTPELAEDYPFVLTTGARKFGLFHSEHRNSPSMRRIHAQPEFLLHPDVAKEKGIEEGDWCRIENNHGVCRMKAHITPRVRKDTISTDHGWWFPERGADDGTLFGLFESNINCLLPYDAGETGYGGPFKALLCNVSKE